MIDRYNRKNFFKTEIVEDISEIDLITSYFNQFKFSNNSSYYTVRSEDLKRPDLISFKIYGQNNSNMWWLIMKANNIEDPFNDLEEGQVLTIPTQSDIDNFYLENRMNSKKR